MTSTYNGISSQGSESRNTSFTDLLMDDFAFDFSEVSSDASRLQQQWEPYRSPTASSSGEDLSTYNYGGPGSTRYSSSEPGESGSIYDARSLIYDLGHWNSVDVSGYPNNVDIDDNPDMILPIPWIPTSSPPGSLPQPAQPQLVDTETYNLKRPCASV